MPILLAVLLFAAAPPPPITMDALFARIRDAQAGVDTLEARFEQTRTASMLAREAVSEGVMYYRRPDRIRWEYLTPDPHTVLIEGDEFSVYYPRLHKLKTARVARLRHRVFNFLLATEPLEKLTAHFQVELREGGDRPAWTLVLTPLTRQIQKTIARVTVQVDKTTALPVELLVEETDGDSTRVRFTAVTPNRGLADDLFRLEVPPSTVREPYTGSGR